MNDKMLKADEVAKILNVTLDTARNKMLEVREFQKKKNRKTLFIRGRVSEKALRECYGL